MQSLFPRRARDKARTPEQVATDSALDELRRMPQPSVPEIHIHLPDDDDSEPPPPDRHLPTWVKVAISLGVPAIVLEVIRLLTK